MADEQQPVWVTAVAPYLWGEQFLTTEYVETWIGILGEGGGPDAFADIAAATKDALRLAIAVAGDPPDVTLEPARLDDALRWVDAFTAAPEGQRQIAEVMARVFLGLAAAKAVEAAGGPERFGDLPSEEQFTHLRAAIDGGAPDSYIDALRIGLDAAMHHALRGALAEFGPPSGPARQELLSRIAQRLHAQPSPAVPPVEPPPLDHPRRGSRLPFGPFLEIDGSVLYQSFRAAIARGAEAFRIPEGGLWPTASLSTRSQSVRAAAAIRPDRQVFDPFVAPADETTRWQRMMARHVMALNDEAADVSDAICAIWLKNARHPDEEANVFANDVLRLRGLTPNMSGNGRRGGYRPSDRAAIARCIEALNSTWITVEQMEITAEEQGKRGPYRARRPYGGESEALLVSFWYGPISLSGRVVREQCSAWRARPGDVFARFLFGPGRQTALLSQKALAFDPYRQKWEKRLARYWARS